MAKRKQNQPQLSADAVRNAGIALILILIVFFVSRWVVSLAGESSLFIVRDVALAEDLKALSIPEIQKLKGQNIFSFDLSKLEEKIKSKNPQLANLRVLRRFPDQIYITATRRDPFAEVAVDGRSYSVDKHGFLIAPSSENDETFTLIKGIRRQKPVSGVQLTDENLKTAFEIIKLFKDDQLLAAVPLRSVDISDKARIVCVVGGEGTVFDVIVDSKNYVSRARALGTLLSHSQVDLMDVKYIDLRFGEPVIGKKKAKKS